MSSDMQNYLAFRSNIFCTTSSFPFLFLYQIDPQIIPPKKVIIVIRRKHIYALGEVSKSATNMEQKNEAHIDKRAIANSRNKSEILLLDNCSISSLV